MSSQGNERLSQLAHLSIHRAVVCPVRPALPHPCILSREPASTLETCIEQVLVGGMVRARVVGAAHEALGPIEPRPVLRIDGLGHLDITEALLAEAPQAIRQDLRFS